MIDIMETIQEKYVPRSDKEKGLKTVFFGGDQLTEERARNVQMARQEGMLRNAAFEPRSHGRIWREGMREGAIAVSVHSLTEHSRKTHARLTQCSKPVKNKKKPVFFNLFVQISGRI